MVIPDLLVTAARSPGPGFALRDAVIELRDGGWTKTEVVTALTDLLAATRLAHRESEAEDAILDTLDAVEGWCHSSAVLFPAAESVTTR